MTEVVDSRKTNVQSGPIHLFADSTLFKAADTRLHGSAALEIDNPLVTQIAVALLHATAGFTAAGVPGHPGVVPIGATTGMAVGGMTTQVVQVNFASTARLTSVPSLAVWGQVIFVDTSGLTVAADPVTHQAPVGLGATAGMSVGGLNVGGGGVLLTGTSSLVVHISIPSALTTNLARLQPKVQVTAAGSPAQAYASSVARITTSVAARNRLPRTQVQFYAQRLATRR